jgi:stearoyl-CoA desaturase (delta-9 desaturase)
VSENAHPSYRQTILVEPTYGHPGPAPEKLPTTRQVMAEWLDAVSFWKDRTRLLPASNALFHFSTFVLFVWFLTAHFSIAALVTVVLLSSFIGNIYNTVWYHRYCSHQAFRFRSIWFARVFLWTNPLFMREESYVIPHRLHHSHSDEPGDPYGPHLGWLGSYLATETVQKTKRNFTAAEYERLVKSLSHVGIVSNTYGQYLRTGSVENLWYYAVRVVCAFALWAAIWWAVAGWWGVCAWMSGAFLFTFAVRDFNYRGHSSLIGGKNRGKAVNQVIYGLFGGEWHENHHNYPRLARTGLRWWQIDVPYYVISAMKCCGIVSQCNSRRPAEVFREADAEIVV